MSEIFKNIKKLFLKETVIKVFVSRNGKILIVVERVKLLAYNCFTIFVAHILLPRSTL